MEDNVTRCDVCKCIIERSGTNCMIWPADGDRQVWVTDYGNKDVCSDCCSTLLKAAELGLIEIDMAQFYERAGFVRDGDHWWLEPIIITKEELVRAITETNKDANL